MECWARVCNFNKDGICTKYDNEEELWKDYEKGGGCIITWFYTGDIPKVRK